MIRITLILFTFFAYFQQKQAILTGVYKGANCPLTIELTGTKSNYSYYLKCKAKNIKGKAIVSLASDGKSYNVELKGAEMAEPSELRKSTNITFSLSKDTITIQNTGNSMNYYVQLELDGCDEKYITLVKMKK
ncbi:MAG: hypothetical protein EOO98_00740 [Pedobacter sp.]|nr:MAG: hypothetical protein EOO98_00740 [Pedobacter sp.]